MNLNIFSLRRWTKLDLSIEHRSNVFPSIFAMTGVFTGVLLIIIDTFHQLYTAVLIDSILVLAMFIVYKINENKKHHIAKYVFYIIINLILFIYSNLIPKEIGTYLFYFPLIGTTAALFDNFPNVHKYLLMVIPLVLLLTLEIFDYQALGSINIEDDRTSYDLFFSSNLIVSLIVTFIIIYQLTNLSKQMGAKRALVAEQLYAKNKKLEKTNKELDFFVYSASHDLKAPLSSIEGLIQIVRMEIDDAKSLEYFDMIEKRVHKLNDFIRDIINLSRNYRLELSMEPIKLSQLIDNIIENNKFMTNASDIDFRIKITGSDSINYDKSRLEIILNNLISNSVKYHKNYGSRYVVIYIKISKNNISILVSDNGIGISKELQMKVFDMFYRGHETIEGSGLGLYIVSEVVHFLKGKIKLYSRVNKGTKISIKIPI